MRRPRTLLLAATGPLLALTLAGCGGGGAGVLGLLGSLFGGGGGYGGGGVSPGYGGGINNPIGGVGSPGFSPGGLQPFPGAPGAPGTSGQPGANPLAGGGSAFPPQVNGPGASDLTAPPGGLGAEDYDWRKDAVIARTRKYRDWNQSQIPFIKETMSNASSTFDQGSLATQVHETVHQIHNDLENANGANRAVYIDSGTGLLFSNVGFTKQQVGAQLSETVKAGATIYKDYLTNETGVPFDPSSGQAVGVADATFLFDEWGAYIADLRAALELQKAGQWQGNEVIGTNGVMAFLYYCSKIAEMAPQNHFDSQQGRPHKAAYALQAERSAKWIAASQGVANSSAAEAGQLFNHFRTSPESAGLRAALIRVYGKGYTRRVFGFEQ